MIRRALLTLVFIATCVFVYVMTSKGPAFLGTDYFSLPDDLEITVWAVSPQVMNPTNMDIDAQGRIWITEGVNYRHNKDKRSQGDRIVVLEDTDKDGKADQSWTFFQDKTLIAPLGIAVVGREIYLSQPPHLYKFTDVDGDARYTPGIDKKEHFLSGFAGVNHDHSLHSVTAGPDGELYFNVGNAGGYDLTDTSGRNMVGGSYYNWGARDARQFVGRKSADGHTYVGGSAFRIRPDGSGLQVIGHNFRNSYEQTVTSLGDVFQNDNDDHLACRTSWLMEYGNAGYASNDGLRKWRVDQRPGQPQPLAHWRQSDPGIMPAGDIYGTGSPTGIAFYENGALPKKYRGLLISCDAALNTLLGYYPKDNKAGKLLERFHLLTSNASKELAGTDSSEEEAAGLKTWFRPSDVCVGPDGALYVADWFDSRLGGHQTFDKGATGTIYRIAPKGFVSQPPPVDTSTVEGAVEVLCSPAVNVRNLGFQALVGFGDAAVEPVARLLEHENPHFRYRAVWVLSRLGSKGRARTAALLDHSDAQLRLVAYRALRRVTDQPVINARRLAKDDSPAVRREVAISLRDTSFAECQSILLELARSYEGLDRAYLEAFGTACSGKEDQVYAMLKQEMGATDPAHWSDAFERLAWRLHPENAVSDLKRRALSKVNLASRRLATDALAFVPTKPAGDAMLEIARNCPDDLYPTVRFWIENRDYGSWKHLTSELDKIKRHVATIEHSEQALFEVDKLELSTLAQEGRTLFMGRGTCFACHRMGDKGSSIGPDLSQIGAKYNASVIREAIEDPSSAIVFGYELSVVKTKQGGEVRGFVISDADPLIITDIAGRRHKIDLQDIESRETLHESIMPSAEDLKLTRAHVQAIAAFCLEASRQTDSAQ